ncbi:MAG TPA: hypothetical protein VNH11_16850 [Pirellulales bacterium]|nr:hypothetical protein [Pirellulales bacterium]
MADASVRAFAELYASLGYEGCGDGRFQRGFEKVALFAKDGAPTHAARQLPDARWTSKLGRWEDIAHRLEALTGNEPNEYGEIVVFFRRPNASFGRRSWLDALLDATRTALGTLAASRRR